MAPTVVDLSSSDDEQVHVFVDWKKSVARPSDIAAPKVVVCVDSDSDEAPQPPVTSNVKEAATSQVLPQSQKSTNPCNNTSPDSRKRKLLQDKEAQRVHKQEERALRKQEKEELKKQQKEEKRQRREAEKLRRTEVKEKAAQTRKLDQERHKWEKGKFALQNTVAMIDCKVVEHGLIGGQLLNRLGEKELKYRLCSNPIPHSIMWKMKRPSDGDSQDVDMELQLEEMDVPYLLFVFEAEEFSGLVSEGSLDAHVRQTQSQYPGFTVCYLVNKLHWYLQKRDQEQYRRGEANWVRPNADKALAELLTNYAGVHSRLCLDEAEVAEHIVGLTRSLAESPFKQKLTSLFVSKNGDHIVNNDPNKEAIKKSAWLKALVAIPRVSGAIAIAISKRYPTFRSLLNAYMDCTLAVHEKELLLQDIQKGEQQGRRVGPVCSRRIYRILMTQNGNLKTEEVEAGADQFED